VPGTLLGVLLLGGAIRPGFTAYWGYLVAQTAFALALVALLEARLADVGGLSWRAHALAGVALTADVVGNSARWYARYAEYDKLVHVLSLAAITTVLADGLGALGRRGTLSWSPMARLVAAAVLSVALGLGWEGYEYVGDAVFATGRSQGWRDTTLDLACDALGALTAALLLRYGSAAPLPSSPRPRLPAAARLTVRTSREE